MTQECSSDRTCCIAVHCKGWESLHLCMLLVKFVFAILTKCCSNILSFQINWTSGTMKTVCIDVFMLLPTLAERLVWSFDRDLSSSILFLLFIILPKDLEALSPVTSPSPHRHSLKPSPPPLENDFYPFPFSVFKILKIEKYFNFRFSFFIFQFSRNWNSKIGVKNSFSWF